MTETTEGAIGSKQESGGLGLAMAVLGALIEDQSCRDESGISLAGALMVIDSDILGGGETRATTAGLLRYLKTCGLGEPVKMKLRGQGVLGYTRASLFEALEALRDRQATWQATPEYWLLGELVEFAGPHAEAVEQGEFCDHLKALAKERVPAQVKNFVGTNIRAWRATTLLERYIAVVSAQRGTDEHLAGSVRGHIFDAYRVSDAREAMERGTPLPVVVKTRAGGQEQPAPRRTTVVFDERTQEALDRTIELTGDRQTDVINKAIRVYSELREVSAGTGGVYCRQHSEAELERVRFL